MPEHLLLTLQPKAHGKFPALTTRVTQRRGLVGRNRSSCYEGPWLKSQTADWLSSVRSGKRRVRPLRYFMTDHFHTSFSSSCINHTQLKRYIVWQIFYVYGSVHRWSVLIIVQRDATQSSLFIVLQVHCTCFGFNHTYHQEYTKCNYSLRYRSYFLCSYLLPTWPRWR